MKIGFYTPSLHIGGGGEKYLTAIIAEAVKPADAEVTVMSPTPPHPQDWTRLGVNLSPTSFVWEKTRDRLIIPSTRGLDLFVAMRGMDVPPVSHAKRSVAIVQFPERDLFAQRRLATPRGLAQAAKAVLERRAVASYDCIVCYSEFAERYVAKNFGRPDAIVIHPPVDAATHTAVKETVILGVGRLFPMKRHDVLITAFRQLKAALPESSPWELHLAGGIGTDQASNAYLAYLRQLAGTLPVTLHPNIPLADLRALYERASLFWHAAGFGHTDEPALQEHFGITTVEAMNHGCVPLVIALGGQPEIVTDGSTGLLWLDPEELVSNTLALILEPRRRLRLAQAATRAGTRFSPELFRERIREIILPA